ncbi:MAG TPA: indoleacetamide hydrolase [Burkholderiales bacterium]|nr:indoleacetamide hydrolase [Burkholderiales bacterium]
MKRFLNGAAVAAAFVSMAAQAQVALTEMTVAEAAREIRAGTLKSEDLVRALAAQIERKKNLNAFIEFDRERALAEARARDAEAAARKWRGPLHGVPIVVKDNIHVRGYANTAGTPALKGFRPKAHAPVVASLLRAGAIVIGKTNMHELAFGITSNNAEFGPARNPYDPKRIAGGSSGGTGSAVAARLAPAGLGTDTGGSVRIPAALTGIAGLRPTLGRYPQEGITPIAHTRDTAGPMARTVEDLAMLDTAITGAARNPKPMPLKGVRIGVEKAYFFRNIDAETQKLALAALDKLKAAGAQIVEVQMPGLADLNAKVSFPVALFEANVDLARYLKKHGLKLDVKAVADRIRSPDVKGVFAGSIVPGAPKPIPAEAYKAALKTRPALQKLYAETFAKNRIVALAFPTTPLPAAPIGDDATTKLNGKDVPTFPTFIQNTDPGSNAGIPGLTLPIGRTKAGLPVGLELDGPAGSDRRLLALGIAAEQVFGRLPPP